MSKPDQRLFEADLQSAAFRSGVLKHYWGLAAADALPEEAAWPKAFLWLAAEPRPGAPDRFHIVVDVEGYGAQQPTGTFWDPTKKERLAHGQRPRGKENSRVAKVFRTDWNDGTAFYHPYDRVAATGHDKWPTEMPGTIWKPTYTIVDFLDALRALVNCPDYVGV